MDTVASPTGPTMTHGTNGKQQVIVAVPGSECPPTTVSRETKRRRVEACIQTKITSDGITKPNQSHRTKQSTEHSACRTRSTGVSKARTVSRPTGEQQYILTPNKKRVDLEDFHLRVDSESVSNLEQGTTHAAYRAEVDHWMMVVERAPNIGPWFPSFRCDSEGKSQGYSYDECRLEAIKRFFQLGKDEGLKVRSVHLAVHTLGRLFSYLAATEMESINERVVACCIGAAWRLAIKFNEIPQVAYNASHSMNIQRKLIFLSIDDQTRDKFDEHISRVERVCAGILSSEFHSPFAMDFFDRFLVLGGWPKEMIGAYRDLGHFLLSMSCFSSTNKDFNPLQGTYPSKLAMAALVLSVKIINTDQNMIPYEFYPAYLQSYTGYEFQALRPTIRSISNLLREKPKQSAVLEGWFPTWAKHGWY